MCWRPEDLSPLAMLNPASPNPMKPTANSLVIRFVNVPHAKFCQLGAQPIHVQSEGAAFELFAVFLFLCCPLCAESRHFGRCFTLDDNHAVGIAHNHISGTDDGSRADNGNVHRTGT